MNISDLTDAQRAAYNEAVSRSEKASALLHEYKLIMERMKKEFPPNLFGMTATQIKKENRPDRVLDRVHHATQTANRLMDTFYYQNQAKISETRKREEEERKRRREAEAQQLTADAILWIQEHYPDRRLGVDFGVVDAVEYANSLAFYKEIENIETKFEWHGFSGQNCSDYLDDGQECAGWDGKSKRCQCGNRRVDWQQGCMHSFKSPHVVAEAY